MRISCRSFVDYFIQLDTMLLDLYSYFRSYGASGECRAPKNGLDSIGLRLTLKTGFFQRPFKYLANLYTRLQLDMALTTLCQLVTKCLSTNCRLDRFLKNLSTAWINTGGMDV